MSTSKQAVTTRSRKPAASNWPPKSILEPGNGHKWVPTVAFDLHEVIVSFMAQFAEYANTVYPDANLKPSAARFYDPGYDPEVNISPIEWNHLFSTFCMLAPGGYGDLPVIPGVIDQLKKIKDAGIHIEIWTWVPGATSVTSEDHMPLHSGVAQRQTLELIERLGIPVDVNRDVKFVAPNQKARRLGQKHIPLLVEDNRSTAVNVADMAHAAILVPTTYNQVSCPNVLRLRSRNELAARVIEVFDALREQGLLLEGRR